jgi:hypothetical protein
MVALLRLGGQRRSTGSGEGGDEGEAGAECGQVFHDLPLGCRCDMASE